MIVGEYSQTVHACIWAYKNDVTFPYANKVGLTTNQMDYALVWTCKVILPTLMQVRASGQPIESSYKLGYVI